MNSNCSKLETPVVSIPLWRLVLRARKVVSTLQSLINISLGKYNFVFLFSLPFNGIFYLSFLFLMLSHSKISKIFKTFFLISFQILFPKSSIYLSQLFFPLYLLFIFVKLHLRLNSALFSCFLTLTTSIGPHTVYNWKKKDNIEDR